MFADWQRVGTLIQQSPRLGRWLTGLGILTVAALVSGAIIATGPSPTPQAASEKTWPVSTVVAAPADLAPSFSAYGRVEARNLASLSADLFETIRAIHVKEGDRVSAGTVLVELDDSELALDVRAQQAAFDERSANVRSIESELAHLRESDGDHRSMLEVANAKLARHAQLRQDRLISDSLFDEVLRQTNEVRIAWRSHSQRLADLPNRLQAARALQDGASAALARAQLIAAKTQLIAPFDGIVLAVPAAIGARAQPGTTLVQIADLGAYEMRIAVPPAYRAQFQAAIAGADATPAISARTADGADLVFSRLAGAVQTGHTSADALFSWPLGSRPDAAVGSTVELRVQLPPASQVVALPAQSLYENQRVYVVEQERLRPVTVERVGERRAADGRHQVLVRSAELVGGTRVVTTQLPKAIAGLKVQATAEPTATAMQNAPEPVPATEQANAAAAQKAEQIVQDKRRQAIKAAAGAHRPAEISLPTSTQSPADPRARAAGQAARDQRVQSRRYRMT